MTTRDQLRLRAASIEWRLIDDEVVALDLGAAEYLLVNRTGAVLFPLLAEGATRDALVGRLVDRYGITTDAAGADVDAFVEILAARSLLES